MMTGRQPMYVRDELYMAMEAVRYCMAQNSVISKRVKSGGNCSLFTLPVIALLNSHIKSQENCPLYPIRWHPLGDRDLKVEAVRRKSMRATWIEVPNGLVPAYIVKEEYRNPFDEYLKAYYKEEPKAKTRKCDHLQFSAYKLTVPNFLIRPTDELSNRYDKAVGPTYKHMVVEPKVATAPTPDFNQEDDDESEEEVRESTKQARRKSTKRKRKSSPPPEGTRRSRRENNAPARYSA